MSRVLFVASNTCTDPYPVYPLGMAVVSAALAARGHAVRQFDFLAAGRSVAALRAVAAETAPDYVCLSVRNVDSADSAETAAGVWLGDARRAVAVLREITAAPIIVGGPAFSILPEEILAALGADYGIVGEGERALPDLLDRLAAGERPVARILRGAVRPLAGD
jgi:lipid biosynthesis B12-binding/radical SAM protein